MRAPAKRPEEKAPEPSKPIAAALANAGAESRKGNLGSDDPEFSEHLLTQIINLGRVDKRDSQIRVLSVVR
jgi:hypothetical protein